MRYITSIRITFQGAYAINGVIGEKQYFYFTKREAIRKYNQEAKQKLGGKRK